MALCVSLRSLDVTLQSVGMPGKTLQRGTPPDVGFEKIILGSGVTDGLRRVEKPVQVLLP